MRLSSSFIGLLAAVFVPSWGWATEPTPSATAPSVAPLAPTSSAPAPPAVAPSAVAPTVSESAPVPRAPALTPTPSQRDPEGRTGVSPLREALLRGDAAYLARDFALARHLYQQALTTDPQNAWVHLRLAEVCLAESNFVDAKSFVEAGVRFGVTDPSVRLRALLLRGVIYERAGELEGAVRAWDELERAAVVVAGPLAGSVERFRQTALERKARVQARSMALVEGAAVKERTLAPPATGAASPNGR